MASKKRTIGKYALAGAGIAGAATLAGFGSTIGERLANKIPLGKKGMVIRVKGKWRRALGRTAITTATTAGGALAGAVGGIAAHSDEAGQLGAGIGAVGGLVGGYHLAHRLIPEPKQSYQIVPNPKRKKDMPGEIVRIVKQAPGEEEEYAEEEQPVDEQGGDVPGDQPPPEEPEGAVEEPYGAQVLRRIYDDYTALIQDYDEMMQVLEHEGVKHHLMSLLTHIADNLQSTEELFSEAYQELGPLNPEGMEGDQVPGDTDEAVGADSQELEEVSPEEAYEGSQRGAGDEYVEEEYEDERGQKFFRYFHVKQLNGVHEKGERLRKVGRIARAAKPYLLAGGAGYALGKVTLEGTRAIGRHEAREGYDYGYHHGERSRAYDAANQRGMTVRRSGKDGEEIIEGTKDGQPKQSKLRRYLGTAAKVGGVYAAYRVGEHIGTGGRRNFNRVATSANIAREVAGQRGYEHGRQGSPRDPMFDRKKALDDPTAVDIGGQTPEANSSPGINEPESTGPLQEQLSPFAEHAEPLGGAVDHIRDLSTTSDFSDEHRMKSYHFHKTLEGIHSKVGGMFTKGGACCGNKDLPPSDSQEAPVNEGDEQGEWLAKVQGQHSAVGEASQYLGEMAQTKDFGDPHRQMAMQHLTKLEPILEEANKKPENHEEPDGDEHMAEDAELEEVSPEEAQDEVDNGNDVVEEEDEDEETGEKFFRYYRIKALPMRVKGRIRRALGTAAKIGLGAAAVGGAAYLGSRYLQGRKPQYNRNQIGMAPRQLPPPPSNGKSMSDDEMVKAIELQQTQLSELTKKFDELLTKL